MFNMTWKDTAFVIALGILFIVVMDRCHHARKVKNPVNEKLRQQRRDADRAITERQERRRQSRPQIQKQIQDIQKMDEPTAPDAIDKFTSEVERTKAKKDKIKALLDAVTREAAD